MIYLVTDAGHSIDRSLARIEPNGSAKQLTSRVPPVAAAIALLCGLYHRQRQRQCANTSPLLGGHLVSDSDYDRKGDLECLRLASDLMQLAAETSNPHLKGHWLWMARVWSGKAEKKPAEYTLPEQTCFSKPLLPLM
jgi:hypothetical protein